ncbi:phenylacetic acid degradation protein [Bradyrhizobium macuxiense]|uniref:Phenylacetic acid degradation protein n=1 Tax=Bradyrhizobium macuxiense TaxID=1755647 RepID=A0A125Q5V6_9BRAD|nr:PaaI family thioesterase [Bradyrhizobium macuxiense]KWV45950.1 phenylacetic acid degradation protein [Bradyrhizobium macuxiense]
MTTSPGYDLKHLIATNASAAFNRLIGLEVVAGAAGEVEFQMPWRDDFTQYAGHLHAGMIAALLDTACGFAAATVVGKVTASHFSMNCLRPAVGRRFVVKGRTLRAGRKQTFAQAELFAEDEQGELSLVATGETVLVPLGM